MGFLQRSLVLRMDLYVKKISELVSDMDEVRIMEVCGGHTHTIIKYGIRDVLSDNIKLISGPGCPVCVTSQHDLDCVVKLALNGVKISTYGDMMRVPGTKMSLQDAQAQGADVKMVYSVDQLMKEKDRVFFAVGFETTAPMTAVLLKKGIPVFSSHKLIPPAMRLLVGEMNLHGFIDPGHVSAIIGSDIWTELDLGVPQVIAGFRPDSLIKSTYTLIKLIKDGKKVVVNGYPELVKPKGNPVALKLMDETMKPEDSAWRGIGTLPLSGLAPRDDKLNARVVYADMLKDVKSVEPKGCRCGEVIRGLIEPKECGLFGKGCTMETPMGACMVSENEGACAIAFKYGRSLAE